MLKEIITAMSTLIAANFTETIYIQNQGEGFERPSFFITHFLSGTDDLSRYVYNNNIQIQIVYFAPWDEYKNVDAFNQYDTSDTLKKIFAEGYFMVGDRAVKVNGITGGPRNSEVYLTLALSITDSRNIPADAPITDEVFFNM